MKCYLALLALLFLSMDVFAGTEEATTTFNVKSRLPVCDITYPAVVDLGTIVSTGNFTGQQAIDDLAEFSVNVACDLSSVRPNIRFWDANLKYPHLPAYLFMQPISGNNSSGEMVVRITDKTSGNFMCLTPDPRVYESLQCLGYIKGTANNYTSEFSVSTTFNSFVLGEWEGRVNLEVYFP